MRVWFKFKTKVGRYFKKVFYSVPKAKASNLILYVGRESGEKKADSIKTSIATGTNF